DGEACDLSFPQYECLSFSYNLTDSLNSLWSHATSVTGVQASTGEELTDAILATEAQVVKVFLISDVALPRSITIQRNRAVAVIGYCGAWQEDAASGLDTFLGQCTIDLSREFRAFHVQILAGVVLCYITITNGQSSESGGAVSLDGSLRGSEAIFLESSFVRNSCDLAGGALFVGGEVALISCTFSENQAEINNSGDIYLDSMGRIITLNSTHKIVGWNGAPPSPPPSPGMFSACAAPSPELQTWDSRQTWSDSWRRTERHHLAIKSAP
ncbi:hypothetical protein CYMTET_52157, partial [Cymbomonas tetramitiformis]